MDHGDMGHGAMDHGAMGHETMDHGAMDHETMDHGAMNHAAMEHGASEDHPASSPHAMMMAMSFHGGCNEVILFDFWKISTVGGLVGSMIGCFLLGILYEGLKFYREFLMAKGFSSSVPYNNVMVSARDSEGGSEENSITSAPATPPRRNSSAIKVLQTSMLSKTHFLQTLLHLVQMTLSYFLMLVAMTYNTWLFGAVVAGAATGYFLFGWKKTVMMEAEGGCH